MPIREIRNGRPAARRPVRQIRRMVPVPDDFAAPDEEASVPAVAVLATVDEAPPRRRRRAKPGRSRLVSVHLPRRTVVLALLLCVAALAGLAITGQRWYHQQRLESAREGALAAARQTTVDFVSISAATVDRDLQRIAAGATGDFKDEFTRGLPQVRTAVVENKVSSTGSVLRAALGSSDLDSAVALVAIDASVKNTGAPDGRTSHHRIQADESRDPA